MNCFTLTEAVNSRISLLKKPLTAFGIKRSLSHPKCPYDNAVAESLYKIITTEFVRKRKYDNLDQLKTELFDYINWYNTKRIHGSLRYVSPVDYQLRVSMYNCPKKGCHIIISCLLNYTNTIVMCYNNNIQVTHMGGRNMKNIYLFIVVSMMIIGIAGCVQSTTPESPTEVTITVVSDTEIEVFWTDHSENETNFIVQYGNSSDFSDALDLSVASNVTSTAISSLEENTEYYVRVKAVNNVGSSTWSNVVSTMTSEEVLSSITLHFLNNDVTNWNDVLLNYWYDDGEETVSNDWPGTAMTKGVDSNWYTAVIEGATETNVLFTTSQSSSQTVDLYRSSEGWFVPTGFDSSTGNLIGTWYEQEPTIDTSGIDFEMIDEKRQQVLAYITNLSFGNATQYTGTISGQNCYHGNQITDQSWIQGYQTMIEDLFDDTGEWVGMIGIDYEYDQIFAPSALSAANQYLIDYANQGGLITINFSPQNPWVNDESNIYSNPGSPTGDASPQSEYSRNAVTSLSDLIDEDKPVHEAWMRKLNRIADALEELRDAGVIVLWRPMQEMNGNWMWWGMGSHPDDPQPFIDVYRHMYNYYTNIRGLNNLIWVYSPTSTHGDPAVINNTANWNRNVTWAYPGDSYVDIVAGTVYDNDVILYDYDDYVSLGKPMGLAEIGPSSTENDYQMDSTVMIEQISTYYPRIAYWVSWHWNWAIIRQHNATDLLTDSRVINRGDFDTTQETGDTIDNPTA